MMTRRRAVGSNRTSSSSSIVARDVSSGGKRPRKQQMTYRPVQNVLKIASKCQRKVKMSAAATTADRPVATTATSRLAVTVTTLQAGRRRVVPTYPPPYPIVPPHGLDPSWRKVPFAPAVEACRTGPNSVSVTWDNSGHVRPAYGLSADISFYELYVCQETEATPDRSMWHLTGPHLPLLPMPMVCDLEYLPAGHRYHFVVRPVDVHERRGPFGVAKAQL